MRVEFKNDLEMIIVNESKMKNYNKKIISVLFLVIITLLLVLVFVKSGVIDFTWTTLLLSLAVSLLSSFLFFVVFRGFDDDKKEDNKAKIMREIGIFSKIEDKYWIELISELNKTKDDIIFYGHTMGTWLDKPQFKNPLIEKLKNKKEGTKVYFIIHDEIYCGKWNNLFTQENIKEISIIRTEDKPVHSIACCGAKMSIILTADPKNMDDRITFEILSKSDIGQVYIEYLNSLRNDNS